MDPTLLLTLGVILAATLVGAALRGLHRDRCLRDFDGRPVIVLGKGGTVIWGTVRLQATGFELEYPTDELDRQFHVETSYLIYKSEYSDIEAICCFLDDLSAQARRRRDEALERAFHPGPLQCLVRQLRNFVNTAIDSLNEVLTLLLGRARPLAGQLAGTSQTHLKGLTKNILGYVGTSYDPLLERLVGVQSVVEVRHDGERYEFVGVLRDYSPDFLELLDVYLPRILRLRVTSAQGDGGGGGEARVGALAARLEGSSLLIRNRGNAPMRASVSLEEGGRRLARGIVAAGESWRVALPGHPEAVHIEARVVVQLDVIFPRATALIRHRAERYATTDAFVQALQIIAARDRTTATYPLGAGAPYSYQELLLNHPESFASDVWLSQVLEQREHAQQIVQERAETVQQRQQWEQVENETPS
jgi:hypothetical protein